MKYVATLNGKKYEVEIERVDEYRPLDRGAQASAPAPILAAAPAPKAAPAPAAAPAAPAGAAGAVAVTAPMPGKILGVKASAGQAVKRGQVLLILEAMKMENNITADTDGKITAINVSQGESVLEGTDLVIIE